MTYYFADAMEEVDRVAEDKGLKESLGPVSYTHLGGKRFGMDTENE